MFDYSENVERVDLQLAESPVKLKVCDLARCEARCCYDGVYLHGDEPELIEALVEACPELFAHLPQPALVSGEWGEHVQGTKTATVPYTPQDPDYPAHFTRTRCAFLTKDYLCSLQVASVALGLHKWTFKPRACWEFPLTYSPGVVFPPPGPGQVDPDYVDETYPGYTTFTCCGRYEPEGRDWREALSEEIQYIADAPDDPSWHRLGLTLPELIALARERYQQVRQDKA